jgi:hypothetical protein
MTSAPVRDQLDGPSHHAGKRGLHVHRLPALSAGHDPLDGSGCPAPISWVSLACELQRDWARTETVPAIVENVRADRLPKG